MSTLSQRVAAGSFYLSHLTFLTAFLMGVYLGNTPLCIPYLSGCTSITATGIPDPQSYIFRGGLISACALFVFWWYCMQSWLTLLSPGKPILTVRLMVTAGVISSICLIVATAVIRPDRANLPWQVHSFGAALFFLISILVQTRVTVYLHQLKKTGVNVGTGLAYKKVLIVAQWLFLILMAFLQILGANDSWKNIVEWWVALLIGLFYLSSHRDWSTFRLMETD